MGRAVLRLLGPSVLLAGCMQVHHVHREPVRLVFVTETSMLAHSAPLEGHRLRNATLHGAVDLVYDSLLGAYRVIGLEHLYFLGDRYYRLRDGAWLTGRDPFGDWTGLDPGDVPRRLLRYASRGASQDPVPASPER
jgi:hypothetical protein